MFKPYCIRNAIQPVVLSFSTNLQKKSAPSHDWSLYHCFEYEMRKSVHLVARYTHSDGDEQKRARIFSIILYYKNYFTNTIFSMIDLQNGLRNIVKLKIFA